MPAKRNASLRTRRVAFCGVQIEWKLLNASREICRARGVRRVSAHSVLSVARPVDGKYRGASRCPQFALESMDYSRPVLTTRLRRVERLIASPRSGPQHHELRRLACGADRRGFGDHRATRVLRSRDARRTVGVSDDAYLAALWTSRRFSLRIDGRPRNASRGARAASARYSGSNDTPSATFRDRQQARSRRIGIRRGNDHTARAPLRIILERGQCGVGFVGCSRESRSVRRGPGVRLEPGRAGSA